MKNLVLATLVLVSANAHAGQTLEVGGAKAAAIIKALKAAGVTQHPFIESSALSVSNLKLEYTPRAFIWAQGQLTDNGASGKTLHPIAGQAFDVYSALVSAGVQADQVNSPIPGSVIELKRIDCASGFDMGARSTFASCTIQ